MFIMKKIYVFEWLICRYHWTPSKWHAWFKLENIKSVYIVSEQPDENHRQFWNGQQFQYFCYKKVSFYVSFISSILQTNRGWQGMEYLMNTEDHNIFSRLFHRYINFCHTSWLVYANGTLSYIMLFWYLYFTAIHWLGYTYNDNFEIYSQKLCISTSSKICTCRIIIA